MTLDLIDLGLVSSSEVVSGLWFTFPTCSEGHSRFHQATVGLSHPLMGIFVQTSFCVGVRW